MSSKRVHFALLTLLVGLAVFAHWKGSPLQGGTAEPEGLQTWRRRVLQEDASEIGAGGEGEGDLEETGDGEDTEGEEEQNGGSHTSNGQHPDGGEHEHKGIHGEVLVVFFVAMGLLIGAVCKEIKKMTGIPYTPMLMVAGALVGRYSDVLGDFGAASKIVTGINPHGILMIFIPTIIFESAFNADSFIFKKEIGQVLILAGLGVAVGAVMLAFCFNYILGYSSELPFSAAMTFGSIVCATDPVAVVALLKELGTPLKFNLLLEGESLLNDGTAMVAYIIFSSIYKAQGVTILGVFLQFIQLSIGGSLLGAVACFLAILWLSRIVKDDLLTITITFFTCYISFFIGEMYLGVSGIIAIVTLGVLMGMYGTVRINPESTHSMHSVWSFVQFAMETLIFIITGLYIGIEYLDINKSTITYRDFINMLIFFVLMTICRYLMLLMMFPLLNKTGFPVTMNDVVILTYGGLRGAIALCLGLMVITDTYPDRFKDLVLFYLCGMITLTVLVNGLTIKYVMKMINFMKPDPIKEKFMDLLNKNLVINSVKKMDSLKNNRFFNLVDWEDVKEVTKVNQLVRDQNSKDTKGGKAAIELRINGQDPKIGEEEELDDYELIETRQRIYMLVKSQIWERFEENMCSSNAVKTLGECCDFCMEDLKTEMWLWECVSQYVLDVDSMKFLLKWTDVVLIGRIARSFILSDLRNSYEILSTLIMSIQEVLENKSSIPIQDKYLKPILKEISKDRSRAEERLFYLTDSFPNIIKSIQIKQASSMVLNDQKNLLDANFHQGMINQQEHELLRKEVEKTISKLNFSNLNWEVENKDELLMVAPQLAKHSESVVSRLIAAREKRTFNKDEFIFQKKKNVDGLYIIAKGVVEETIGADITVRLGLGSLLNFAHIVSDSNKAMTTAKVISNTTVYFIPKTVLKECFEEDYAFKEYCHMHALGHYVRAFPPKNLYFKIEDYHIQELMGNSEFSINDVNEIVELPNGGYMYYGDIVEDNTDRSNINKVLFNEPSLIKPTIKIFRVQKKSCFIKFTVPIEETFAAGGGERHSISRPSFARGAGTQPRASMRMSVMNVANLEGDVDLVYNKMVAFKFQNLLGVPSNNPIKENSLIAEESE